MALLSGRPWPAKAAGSIRWKRGAVASICVAIVLMAAGAAPGHVGNRLRMGYRPEPPLEALARITKIYLEAVSGFTMDLKEYADPFSLQSAIREEKVDVAVEYPAEAWARTACPTGATLMENLYQQMKAYYREKYGAVWVGTFLFQKEGLRCYAPSYVITRGVAGDLAYYTLPGYLKKLLAAITQEDLEAILRTNPKGNDVVLLRDFLARKKLI